VIRGIFGVRFWPFSWPLLVLKNGQLAKTFDQRVKNWENLGEKFRKIERFLAIWPLSAHFYFEKWPQKTVDFQGFAGFLAKNPLIFYTTRRKKVNIYNNIAKKVGFWPQGDFSRFLAKKSARLLQSPL